jgi:hypothetical protein
MKRYPSMWLLLIALGSGCGDASLDTEEVRFRLVNYNFRSGWIELPELGTGKVYAGDQTDLLTAEITGQSTKVNMELCVDDACSSGQLRTFTGDIELSKLRSGPGLIVAREAGTSSLNSFEVLIDQVDRDMWCDERAGDENYLKYSICKR